jgi:hypothetical protein
MYSLVQDLLNHFCLSAFFFGRDREAEEGEACVPGRDVSEGEKSH